MEGEKILAIYGHIDSETWVIFQTNLGLYEVRLGTIIKINPEKVDLSSYLEIENDKVDKAIIQAWTDDHTVYLELEDDSIITIGFLNVDSDGGTHLAVFFNEQSDFGSDFIPFEEDSDVCKVIVGADD